jgi:hypothetical protein
LESYALNREKIVPAGGRIDVYVGPLKPEERYEEFFGEFNASTARRLARGLQAVIAAAVQRCCARWSRRAAR